MSYAIQNFFETKKIAQTPRLKFFFIFVNINKLIFFIKFNTFFKFTNLNNSFSIKIYECFIKYFFSRQFFKLIHNLNFSLVGFYTTHLIKSSVYWIFYFILNYVKFSFVKKNNFKFSKFINNNFYIYSIKTADIRLNNSIAKNSFYFNLFFLPFFWYQHTSNLNFYLNFTHLNIYFKTFKFYNGYFFKIYNF